MCVCVCVCVLIIIIFSPKFVTGLYFKAFKKNVGFGLFFCFEGEREKEALLRCTPGLMVANNLNFAPKY